jgi:hypothetical protein
MNETFYNSLSATQVYELKIWLDLNKFIHNFSELKTDEDDHCQQRFLLNEKHSKLQTELNELKQVIYTYIFDFLA